MFHRHFPSAAKHQSLDDMPADSQCCDAAGSYGVSVRYLALLRGVNVGGKTLIKMADLRKCVEGLGFDGVSTYIASGNVLFESGERDAANLATKIERAIEQQFGLPVKVIV